MSTAQPSLDNLHPTTLNLLERFASRRKRLLIVRGCAAALVAFIAAATFIIAVDYFFILQDGWRWTLSVMAYLAAGWAGMRWGWIRSSAPPPETLAREIQTFVPNLHDDLLSAVELSSDGGTVDSPGFREALQNSIARRVGTLSVTKLLPWNLIRPWLIASVIVVAVVTLLMFIPPMQWGRRLGRAILPGIAIQRAALTQLTLIQPDPPSRYVAEGDAVSIVAKVANLGDSKVRLQWIEADGREGWEELSPRESNSNDLSSSSTLSSVTRSSSAEQTFSGNVTVGSVLFRYRLLAGDAVTLWYELTPQSRPAVVEITKRYEYPAYTRLEPYSETDTHGDLSAVIGTTAEVIIKFDQPVEDAVLRYGLRGRPEPLESVDEEHLVFKGSVPIQTPTSYQVDAVSIHSKLNQPFGPQYNITPLYDSPPTAQWNAVPRSAIVDPLKILDLSAIAEDDLPMDRVVQQFQINNEPMAERELIVKGDSRKIDATWQWDLIDRDGDKNSDGYKLKAGDLIRTRVVAIDRKGLRGESEFLQLLIADQGIDETQRARVNQMAEVVREINRVLQEQTALVKNIEDSMGDDQSIPEESFFAQAETWLEEAKKIDALIRPLMSKSASYYDAIIWSQWGDWFDSHRIEIDSIVQQLVRRRDALAESELESSEDRDQRRDITKDARRLRQRTEEFQNVVVGILECELFQARVSEGETLRRSLRPLIQTENSLPIDRFPRYVNLAAERLLDLSRFGSEFNDLHPKSTQSQRQEFDRWTQTWHARLLNEIGDLSPEREGQLRNLVRQYENELRNVVAQSLIDNNVIGRMNQSMEKLDRESSRIGDRIQAMAQSAEKHLKAKESADKTSDIDKHAKLRRESQQQSELFNDLKSQVLQMTEAVENRERKMPKIDLRFAADLNLIRAAIANVTREGIAPYKDEPAVDVFKAIGSASEVLHSVADIESARHVISECSELERSIQYGGLAKVKQPNRIEYYLRFGPATERLQRNGIAWEKIQSLDQSRYNDDANRARNQITSRLWMPGPEEGKSLVSAEALVSSIRDTARDWRTGFETDVTTARQTIQKYVEKLSEQAKRAADAADKAAEENKEPPSEDKPKDDSQEKPEENPKDPAAETEKEAEAKKEAKAAKEAEEAEQKETDAAQDAEKQAAEVIQSLIDRANNADVWSDPEERNQDLEVARDADAAAALVDEARKEAEQTRQELEQAPEAQKADAQKQNTDALEQLRDQLNQVAEHFEKIEKGESVAASRESLRAQAEESQAEQDLEPLRQKIEEMADAMNVDPRERLKELEKELKNDPAMRNELSDIAKQAIDSAEAQLQQSATEENELRRQLENSDASLKETKRRLRAELASMTRVASGIDVALLNRSNQALGSVPQDPKSAEDLNEARKQLEQSRKQVGEAVAAINQLRGEDELVENMKAASAKMAETLREAIENVNAIEESAKKIGQAAEQKTFENDQQKNEAKTNRDTQGRIMQQVARESQSEQSRSANEDRDRWREMKNDAARRIRDAQNQENDAKRKIDQLQRQKENAKKADRQSEVESTDQQIAQQEERIANEQSLSEAAKKTEELAQKRVEQAEARHSELQGRKLPPLDSASPQTELAQKFTTEAREQLQSLAEHAAAISDRISQEVDPKLDKPQAESLANRQEQITDHVDEAAADLARASRHENRLEHQESASVLDKASQSVTNEALPAARKASETLRESADSADAESSKPSEPVSGKSAASEAKQAESAIQQTADSLAGRSESMPQENQNAEASRGNQGAEQSGKEKARQLDELDRALADSARRGQSQQAAEQGESSQSGQPAEGGQDSAQGEPKSPSSPKAGQMSPTMASQMQRQMQAAAQQRQKMLDAEDGQSSGEGEGDQQKPELPTSQSSNTSNTSGADAPGGDGDIDASDVDRLGRDWGALRERTTDDATESGLQKIPPAYRKQLEAYFREVARRTGSNEASNP